MTTTTDYVTDEQVADAERVLRRAYWQAVRGIAEEVAEAVRTGEIDREEAHDRIHEEVDGSEWVIYTWRNFLVLRYSEDHDAYTDDYGVDGVTDDGQIRWAWLAYAALRSDVCEQFEAELA